MALLVATWFQQSDLATTQHWILIFTGVLTVSLLLLAIVGSVVLVGALKAIKTLTGIATEFGEKANPLMQDIGAISRETRELLEDAKPKIKTISEQMAKTSTILSETAVVAKSVVEKIDTTVTDANARTQRQVARVDGMVSAALDTTAEVVEAVNHGIRVPAQKIAQVAGQARVVAEGLFDRIKGMAGSMPFGHRPGARSTATGSSVSGYRSTSSSGSEPTSRSSVVSSSESTGRTYAAAPRES